MQEMHDDKARTWAIISHLSALIVLLGIPFGNILGPFIVWLFTKDKYPTVDDQGKEAMNFQISMTIYFALALFIAIVFTPVLIGILFYPVAAAIAIADIVLTVIATVKASNNELYRYPITIRLIK
ncbi:MAG: DUF4870 domain-containing protein [Bacteriovoracaceae bacterium]|nr:DUF4870 domain-containing protein [Bacteriovoracaceae bacterium]